MNLSLINEVKNLSQYDFTNGYNTLNNREKVIFWNNVIDDYLSKNKIADELKVHILELKKFVTVQMYESLGTPKGDSTARAFYKSWYVEPSLSGKYQTQALWQVATLQGVKSTHPAGGNKVLKVAPGTGSCNCYYTLSCLPDNQCIEKAATCTASPGCGIMGTTNCDGKCE